MTFPVRILALLGCCALVAEAGCSSVSRQTTSPASPWWADGDHPAASDSVRVTTTRTLMDTGSADGVDPDADAVQPADPAVPPVADSMAVRLSAAALAARRTAYAARTDAERDRVRRVNEYAIWCVERGMWDEARIHLEQAALRDSLAASLHNNLGIVYERLGQRDDARIHYQTAADLNPGRPLYRVNLKRLRAALEAPPAVLPDSLAAEELLLPPSRGEHRPDVGAIPEENRR
ncbi:MAG: tetratricopeptide repeat protein [bacterium]|nr:tetratricopeptide repeat protein [bacterium]